MFVGHFGVALIAKRAAPELSLGTATLAAVAADLICFVLLIAGVETLAPPAHIVWSHSLAMDALYAAAFAAIYFSFRRRSRAAWILGALVLSHWILDTISHPPDMALAPAAGARFGFGLWNSLAATVALEGGFWLLALILYLRSTRSKSRTALLAFWLGAALITFIGLMNPVAGIDPDPRRAAIGGLVTFSIFTAWAYWMNAARAPLKSDAD